MAGETESIDKALVELDEAFLAAPETGESAAWLVDWYMSKVADLDSDETALQAKCNELRKRLDDFERVGMNQIAAKRNGLQFRWGRQFQQEVNNRIMAQGKGKSINTPYGRTGYRSVASRPVVIVEDEAAAIANASQLCPAAVKTSLLKSELAKYAKKNGEALPGTKIEYTPEAENFFPYFAAQLESNETPSLEGETNVSESN